MNGAAYRRMVARFRAELERLVAVEGTVLVVGKGDPEPAGGAVVPA